MRTSGPTIALAVLLVIAVGISTYQYGVIDRLERAERLAEARSLLPSASSGTCLRLLAYEDACIEPWGLATARDDPQAMTFLWKGTPSNRIEIVVNGTVVQSFDVDTAEDGMHGYRFALDPDLEPGSYNATIIARPGN
jgi:hypothetical protein